MTVLHFLDPLAPPHFHTGFVSCASSVRLFGKQRLLLLSALLPRKHVNHCSSSRTARSPQTAYEDLQGGSSATVCSFLIMSMAADESRREPEPLKLRQLPAEGGRAALRTRSSMLR